MTEKNMKKKSFSSLIKRETETTASEELSQLKLYLDQFQKSSTTTFLNKEKTEILSLSLTNMINLIQNNNNSILNKEITQKIHNLSTKINSLTELLSGFTNETWIATLQKYSLASLFTKYYEIFWTILLICRFIDKDFNQDFVSFTNAHINDMKELSSYVSKRELPAAASEIEDFLALMEKSEDINNYKQTGIEAVKEKYVRVSVFCESSGANGSLQIFSPQINADDFMHNYNIIKHVNHPSIIKCIGAIRCAPYCLFFEPLNFPTLREVMDNKELSKNLTPTDLSVIVFELARSLQYLHANRIVHCSLTPDSILISQSNRPILSGFNNAQHLSKSMSYKIPFTPYSAPETIAEPLEYNEEIDVYSFTIILLELYTMSRPFYDYDEEDIQESVLLYDARPFLPNDCKFAEFIIGGWARSSILRPTFDDIVYMMEKEILLFPGTDADVFKKYVEDTKTTNENALRGLLTLTPETLLQLAKSEIDEYVMELVVNVLTDSDDNILISTALDVYLDYIKTKKSFTVSELVTLVNLFPVVHDVEELVIDHMQKMNNLDSFKQILCERLPSVLSVPFLVKHLMNTEEDATFVLDFCAKKPDEFAAYAAEAVATKFADSDCLYKNASSNNIYYRRAFHMIAESTVEHLEKYFKYIVEFSTQTPVSFAPVLSRVFQKIGPRIVEYDEAGVLMLRLAKNGYTKTLLPLIADKEFAKIVLSYVIPETTRQPIECLRMIIEVDKIEELRKSLYEFDVLSVVHSCVKNCHYDFTGAAMAALHIPEESLKNGSYVAKHVVTLFSTIDNIYSVSSLLSILTPFAMKSSWVEMKIVPSVVSNLLKARETVIAARALLMAVAMSQRPNVAKILATPENIEAGMRFIGCGDRNFEYVALRLFAYFTPFITDLCNIEGLIGKLSSVCDDERRAEIALTIASGLPKKQLKESSFKFKPVETMFPDNENIKKALEEVFSE